MWRGDWDLFCSPECVSKIHPGEKPTFFPTVTDYYEALDPHGLGFQPPYMGSKMCFNCCQRLVEPNCTKPTVEEPKVSDKKLFDGPEDFRLSADKGLVLANRNDLVVAPSDADKEDLKSLLALNIVGTITLDSKPGKDDDLKLKLASVRMILLAAYNLGRNRGKP